MGNVHTRRWRLLQVESSIACNLRCVICPWRAMAASAANQGIMSPDVWQALRPHLPEAQSVDLSGGGEPLLQPQLAEWIGQAHAAGCETGFLTNGLLLDEDTAHRLVDAGVDWIGVSMDGATPDVYEAIRVGSDFEQVCRNLARIAALRVNAVPKTMINTVLTPANIHQLEETVSLAQRLGVDQVNFKQCDVIRGQHGRGYGLFAPERTRRITRLERALAKARRRAKRQHVQTIGCSFLPKEQPVCDQDPRTSLFVRHDGAVAPCVNLARGGATTFVGRPAVMPTVHYGRLPADDLLALWEAKQCTSFRRRFEARASAFDRARVGHALGCSWSRLDEALADARAAMPAAPDGCHVCHYLYAL